MMADFRVVCENTRMTANFVKLGFTPGFGLTHTLQRVVGPQKANLLFYTGRRINGETAMEWGIGDIYSDVETIRDSATSLAREIAENAKGFAEEDADQKLLRVVHRLAPSLGVRHLVLPGIEAHGESPAS